VLISVYNQFISKKEKKNFVIVPHSSGINFLKIENKAMKRDILKVSKDQNLLLQFIKNIFDGITKETDHFSETYENDFREIISNDVALVFA
jgi:hypothetical protein